MSELIINPHLIERELFPCVGLAERYLNVPGLFWVLYWVLMLLKYRLYTVAFIKSFYLFFSSYHFICSFIDFCDFID